MPIGVDIEEHNRFDLDNTKLIKRILSNEELIKFNMINSNKRKIEFLCSRWAAKEAIYKLNMYESKNYGDYSILNDLSGMPIVYISGEKVDIDISISHSENYSICVVYANKIQK